MCTVLQQTVILPDALKIFEFQEPVQVFTLEKKKDSAIRRNG